MISIVQSNLFESSAEAWVNPVNTRGVAGKGLALKFAQRFPAMNQAYRQACQNGSLAIGNVLVWENNQEFDPRYIVCFPTKDDWRNPSEMRFIEEGLSALSRSIEKCKITSLAIPALGSGLGGLPWAQVRTKLLCFGEENPQLDITIYEPIG